MADPPGEDPLSTYFVAKINILDEELYAEYLEDFDSILRQYSGKRLAADHDVVLLEGEWPYDLTVILEFDSKVELLAWYASTEYQHITMIRHQASKGDIAMIEGVPDH